jgi:gliding motility-associated-like protein
MRILYSFLLFFFCISTAASFGQRGIDGNRTINAAGAIVNEYTTLTANAAAGATTITVAASGLNANSRFGAGNTLAPGDLIMIIQMQGATILGAPDAFTPAISNPNNATWGAVTNYNNCGKFEYCQVNAVPAGGTTIVVDCGLTNSYTAAGKVQVIRIPRYNTLLIQSPGVLTCQAWNGTTGGILAVEVYGNTSITAGGKISTTGTGFRGGALFTTTGRTTTGLYSCVSLDVGTNKGESVAGYDTDYTPFGGKFCRAAPANGGGGGNVWNCGGGGGGNASLAAWTGQGNPNNTVAGWTTAWNLESASFSTSTSSGGGRGGYSFSSSNQNATTLGPGTIGVTNAWGGSYRYNLGGLGGRPLDYSTGRIYLGGGGGAGEQDNNQGGAGGAGGGIIYITSYGTITGSGNDSIISNGANGGSTNIAGFNAGKDAGGGAGAGGTILINSVGSVSGIFIKANGGIGGNQLQGTVGLGETEGPGGGGGGGYIGLTSGPAAGSQQALGGINGITQSPQLTEFTPNGATMGGAGLTNQAIIRVDTISAANATICSGNTATLTASINGAIVATINWYAAATGGTSIGTGSTFTSPALFSTTTYYVGFCPGTYRIPVVVTVNTSPTTSLAGPNQSVCATSATLAGNTPTAGTGTWTLVSGTGTITTSSSPTSTVSGLGLGANIFQWTITNPPCGTSSTQVTITSTGGPTTANAGTAQTVCATTATLAGNTATTGTGIWTLVSGAGTITTPSSPTSGITGLGIGANVFQWSITSAPCPASTSSVTITGVAAPTTANAGTAQTICGTTASLAGNTATTGTGTWTLVSGSGTITTPSSPTSGITGLGIGANVFQWSIANAPCVASTSSVTITGVAAPTTANAGTVQTVCGTTATLAGNTATTGTGTWTLISGAGTITTPSSPTTGITGLGIGANVFQWSIANAPCVASTSTVTITVTLLADATISSVAPLCLGSPAFNLNAVTGGGTWSGTGITSGAGGTFDPATSGTGTFTITYTISGSCGNTDTTLVTVTPNADATISPSTSLCVSASPINLSATTSGGTWSGTGITNTSAGTFDPATAGIGSHIITYSISGTCGATDTVLISVSSSSDATIVQPATICNGAATFNLLAATTGGTWTGTGITSGVSGTFDPTIAGIGTHIITYSISGTCGAMDTVSITVTSGANASITAVSPMCANATVFNLTAATAGGTWSGTGITDPINGTFDPSLANAGTNTITYTISGACGDTATQNITVNALPTPSFTSDVTTGCAPVCVTFTEAASNTCNTMLFEFGDGNTSASSIATNCYTNSGNYSVTITCTDLNNCSDTTTITNMISVSLSPVANFTASPSGVLPVNSTVSFADISTNGGISLWNFGDAASGTNTSTLSSDTHVYSTEGIYCIVLVASNTNGCADTTSACITIADEATIVIPNVFTPNGDIINDIFYFETTSVKELNCSVYDRWGLKIAEWTTTNDSKAGWDGRTTSGTIASDGVYYFIMNAKTLNNKLIEKNGFIQLLNTK